MNDRFTDMGFSQGHQSCGGGARYFNLEKAKILNCDSEEAKSKSFFHFAFQPFQVFGSRLFAFFFLRSLLTKATSSLLLLFVTNYWRSKYCMNLFGRKIENSID
jgi:hypothetical protein